MEKLINLSDSGEIRYISDLTFATRLKSFIQHVGDKYMEKDDLVNEEYQYLYDIADRLQQEQLKNCNEDDLWYFKALNII